MKKIDKRVERNNQSVVALRKLLHEVIHEPTKFKEDDKLRNALKSQGGLSQYCNEGRGIYVSSINTLKRICEKSLEGGFNALDRLRVSALQAMEDEQQNINRSNKITRGGINQRIAELEVENQVLQQELLLISHLLERSMRQARRYAEQSTHNNVLIICEKEQKEIRAFLTLSINSDVLKIKVKELANA